MADNLDWMKREIGQGLQRLMCLGLERTPAAEVIPLTAAVWLEAVTEGRVWNQELDAPRFKAAFAVLCRQSRAWPLPSGLLDAMPAREQLALTKQPIPADPARAQREMQRVAEMLRMDRKTLAAGGDA